MEKPGKFVCGVCDEQFNNRMALYRHKSTVHTGVKHSCPKCTKVFSRQDDMERHRKSHEGVVFNCEFCSKGFSRKDVYRQHIQVHKRHAALGKLLVQKKITCTPSINDTASNDLPKIAKKRKHTESVEPNSSPKKRCATTTSNDLGLNILTDDHISFPTDAFLANEVDQDILKLYRNNWSSIRTRHHYGKIQDQHNFRIHTLSLPWLTNVLKTLFEKQKTVFKLNFSFGCVLRNRETNELTYHYSCINNGRYLESPVLIRNTSDLEKFLETLGNVDFLEAARSSRPSTKYFVELIPNVTLYITRVLAFPIGSNIVLPAYICKNRGLKALLGDKNGHYTDQLCFFRCLALHKTGLCSEKTVQHLFELYLAHKKITPTDFAGVLLSELPELEQLFQASFYVFELKQTEQNSVAAQILQRSLGKYKPLFMNLFQNHFSYITNLAKYCQSYSCRHCGSHWKSMHMLHRHEMTCSSGTKHVFAGGVYQTSKTIYELLEDDLGICVDEHDRYFPFRATYDFEVLLKPCNDHEKNSCSIEWQALHVPVSVAIASNIPGYEKAKCFISNGDVNQLMVQFLNYLNTLSDASYELLSDKYAWVVKKLEELVDTDAGKGKENSLPQRLLSRFEDYMGELPVLGFNSANYDLNIIKQHLFPVLLQDDSIQFVVKRDRAYLCIKTEKLKFLDAANYLAAGSSYQGFLKAYGNEGDCGKLYFPYEWLTSLEKLEEPHLPPHEAFYSKLKDSNITTEEYDFCQKLWCSHNMKTMRDFLVLYNVHDVVPFIQALENMFAFYKAKQLDIFKDAISLPGISLRYLFRNLPKTSFSLFSEKQKDLYQLYKDNIVGGPSIVFHRYQEAGVTPIREVEMVARGLTPKLCQRILGFDANALYLSAIAKDMPVGFCVRRRAETGFKLERDLPPGTSFACREWLLWHEYQTGTNIQNKFSSTEKLLGPQRLAVDGFDKKNNTVYQFAGCWFHAHDCALTMGKAIPDKEIRRSRTAKNAQYVKDLGYQLVEIHECEWLNQKKANPDIKAFIKKTISLPLQSKYKLTEGEIIEAIRDNKLFGVVECDISVPTHLLQHFSELPPIFKNANVSPADAGPFMEKFAKENQMSDKPRRMLISSMHGEKILLATPIAKWYLDHGLEISKIYQLAQYKPEACFSQFATEVSDARRAGDNDSNNAIVAETMKLIGNSAYGKSVTNKERHRDVFYCDTVKASRKVNSAFFRSLEEITADCHEVNMSKKKLKLDLPLHIGFFVYQYAKLRMLEFYYDFLLRYVDRSDFALCETDTDSFYMAIAAQSLDEIIKPDMREQYAREKHLWFPRTDTPEHQAYDKRTPGLFKEEFSGSGIISLCSKTYYCFSETTAKFSCKGVSRCHSDITKAKYLDVLTSKKSSQGVNKGFRMIGNSMLTYLQHKDAFSYYYIKRKVLDDGVSTTYLDL